MNNSWHKSGNSYYLQEVSEQMKVLPPAVYRTAETKHGDIFLNYVQDSFKFPYKIYGVETDFIERVMKTWNETTSNMGIILNGVKGTGKTVTAELICNKMNLPVIIVTHPYTNLISFLSSIQNNVIIFIDEFEKIFEDNTSILLTIMDGCLKMDNRYMFLLTTNEILMSKNFIQRPGRIRYIKTFKDISIDVIRDIVDDMLIHKDLYEKTLAYISTLPIITIDLLKSIIEEVNIHKEEPSDFENIFNMHDIHSSEYDVYIKEGDGMKLLKRNCTVSPTEFTSNSISTTILIGGYYIGKIDNVFSDGSIEVNIEEESWTDESIKYDKYILPELIDYLNHKILRIESESGITIYKMPKHKFVIYVLRSKRIHMAFNPR